MAIANVLVRTSRPYSVRVGPGSLAEVQREALARSKCVIVTDTTVAKLHRERLEGLEDAPCLELEPGEASKRLSVVERILDFLAEAGCDRCSLLVALGGGAVGDVAGLAASLYMRGIALVHCPTTLLAQVDASVGGKAAVNLDAGKNLAGAFHQPVAVHSDPAVLATLADDELASGLGEAVKTAIISGESLFAFLERRAGEILRRDVGVLGELVRACVECKAKLVAEDERDLGARRLLNLGHTFGHAIEHAAGYGRVPHGVAVAVGLGMAVRASRELGGLEDPELPARLSELLARLGLPRSLGDLESRGVRVRESDLLPAMRYDKKGNFGEPTLVLPRRIGVVARDVRLAPEAWERLSRPSAPASLDSS